MKLVGYRANSVAYSVAWLAERSGRRLDLDRIWRNQCLPESVSAALRLVCQEAHRFLTSQDGNVGEASKKPEKWGIFRDMDITIGRNWRGELIEAPMVSYPPKMSKPEALAAREGLTQVSAERWFALSKWAKERGFLEPWERSLAYSLGRLAAQGRVPSDKQVVQGARIMKRAHEFGFVE